MPARPRRSKYIDSDDESVIEISSDFDQDYESSSSASDFDEPKQSFHRKRTSTANSAGIKRKRSRTIVQPKSGATNSRGSVRLTKTDVDGSEEGLVDIEDVGMTIRRPHSVAYHAVNSVAKCQEELLSWFEQVRLVAWNKRGMPWRKNYDSELCIEEKGQRAYEIWVSEVMLQQTQVATVIAYWQRWIAKWPTIADLAKANIEEVNAAWRGLGYYRRARSLLAGAKTVMSNPKYKGRLPSDPAVMEKEIDGVGRYTAGAICSMAYGVDGNIHRLFTRLLAVHAPQSNPATVKFLWSAAKELVELLPHDAEREGIAGDWNQALMELGSQVCKPVSPDCQTCPLQKSCNAFAELSAPPCYSSGELCTLCTPVPSVTETDMMPSVTIFPMRKEKKASRVEEEVVCITECRTDDGKTHWLFTKRPEKVPVFSTKEQRFEIALSAIGQYVDGRSGNFTSAISSHREIGSILHVFSHINMTYHINHIILNFSTLPPLIQNERPVVWLDPEGTEHANVGTGVKKVWAEVYGAWGKFDHSVVGRKGGVTRKGKGRKTSSAATSATVVTTATNGRIVKKIMMPMMPRRSSEA